MNNTSTYIAYVYSDIPFYILLGIQIENLNESPYCARSHKIKD